jgi:hypothetical protein
MTAGMTAWRSPDSLTARRLYTTGQTAPAGTGRFVVELKADREDEGKDKLDKRFAIAEQLKVGGWSLEIDGDGAVLAQRFGSLSHISPSVEMAIGADETSCG